jgi:hypothetical protein
MVWARFMFFSVDDATTIDKEVIDFNWCVRGVSMEKKVCLPHIATCCWKGNCWQFDPCDY